MFDHWVCLTVKANLGVLHHTLDAVEVREVADRLVGIIQHSSDSLGDERAAQEYAMLFTVTRSSLVYTR